MLARVASPRDWPEDAGHENGAYICRCLDCGKTFIGHKRRIACRECAEAFLRSTPTTATLPDADWK